jgi:hypothetical protein
MRCDVDMPCNVDSGKPLGSWASCVLAKDTRLLEMWTTGSVRAVNVMKPTYRELIESGPDRRCFSDQVSVGAAAEATRWTRKRQSLLSTGLRLPGSGCRFSARMMSIVPSHSLCNLLRGELAVVHRLLRLSWFPFWFTSFLE